MVFQIELCDNRTQFTWHHFREFFRSNAVIFCHHHTTPNKMDGPNALWKPSRAASPSKRGGRYGSNLVYIPAGLQDDNELH
jgi:hypothetical protein